MDRRGGPQGCVSNSGKRLVIPADSKVGVPGPVKLQVLPHKPKL
jgi:hypothetical protein